MTLLLTVSRRMLSTLPTLTANSPQKHQQTHMSTAQCFHRLCNSNLQAGPTTVPSLVLEMVEVASKIHLLEASVGRVRLLPANADERVDSGDK